VEEKNNEFKSDNIHYIHYLLLLVDGFVKKKIMNLREKFINDMMSIIDKVYGLKHN